MIALKNCLLIMKFSYILLEGIELHASNFHMKNYSIIFYYFLIMQKFFEWEELGFYWLAGSAGPHVKNLGFYRPSILLTGFAGAGPFGSHQELPDPTLRASGFDHRFYFGIFFASCVNKMRCTVFLKLDSFIFISCWRIFVNTSKHFFSYHHRVLLFFQQNLGKHFNLILFKWILFNIHLFGSRKNFL